MVSEPVQLPVSVTQGRYSTADEYLQSQFHMLREDLLAPLQRGIAAFRCQEALDDSQVHLYEHVGLHALACSKQGMSVRLTFTPVDPKVDWHRTSRLLYGSLLALSCDDFETIVWATVAHRDARLFTGGSAPMIDIAKS